MATVLPMRPNTNSTGTSNSLSSFPSTKRSGSQSTQNDSGLFKHHHTQSSTSNPSSEHSYHSSLSASLQLPARDTASAANGRPTTAKKTKPVKSQYPASSTEKHVEYILVASFNIDRGSMMEHQYPGPVGGDEHMLAELMLPDQTHLRSQDWTIFFLHKDAAGEEDDEGAGGKRRRKRRRKTMEENGQTEGGAEEADDDVDGDDEDEEEDEESEGSDDDDNIDGPPLVYVLNLVNTKQDNTVKRGAIVKAMAICTRHSFLHIYKPLLLIALEQYFANPVVDTLASLYNAVNSMDLSLMPRLNTFERCILQSTDAKDLFIEKFEAIIAQRMASNNHNHNNKDPSTQDTGAPTSDQNPPSSRTRYGLPRDTHEFESVVRYANIPVPVKVPVALSPETVGDFSLIKLITTFSTPHTTSPTPFQPTHPHLTTSGPTTHPIIALLNALLTQKRVIFLGHNLPSSEVAEAVLGACALASGGMLRGFTRHAFPYTDLTKIDDLLKVPGFIAGVTNPAFAHHPEWWDLLCDLSTGRMRISNKIEQVMLTEGVAFFQQPLNHHASAVFASNGGSGGGGGAAAGAGLSIGSGGISAIAAAGASLSAGLGGSGVVPTGSMGGDPTGDAAFMVNVLKAVEERHGENAIRSKFRRWVLKFTRLAAAFEEVVYGASALQIQASPRMPSMPFAGAGAGGPESPGTPGDSPGAAAPGPKQAGDAADALLPPEVTGHGYVWPTPHARHVELAANATRIEGWRNTRSYYNFIQDLASHYLRRPVKHLDLLHLHDKLAKLRLGHEQSANVYLAFCAAAYTEAEISQLLGVVVTGTWDSSKGGGGGGGLGAGGGQGGGGLFYLALGLLHPRLEVREAVAGLLGRIREHEAGRHFWGGVGRFGRVAWGRVVGGREARLGVDGGG